MTHSEMRSILDDIDYKNWHFRLGKKGEVSFLQVCFQADDHDRPGEWDWQKGRKCMLSEHMTESELVQTALKAVLAAEEHEAREQFRYCEEAIFGPHFDVNALWLLADNARTDERDPPPDKSPLADYIERKGFNRSGLICATDRDE